MDNILNLYRDLKEKRYCHSRYCPFNISDPKPRNIHKASVRDRLLHHAIYRILYPFFDKIFIIDSYSCRLEKGTHRAINRFRQFSWKASHNHTRTIWVLKCDIKKFFASINQEILLDILAKHILDSEIMWLLEKIISSFNSGQLGIGLPLGNLTSQLFVNIYMNEFDQIMKHRMKTKYYIRYADDFVVLSADKSWLEELLPKIGDILLEKLNLNLHPDKVSIKTLFSGVDFLGWVHFPSHRVLRTATRKRMIRKISSEPSNETRSSYLGMLSHGNTNKLKLVISE